MPLSHLAGGGFDMARLLSLVVVASGLASGLLAGIGIWAYYRRRSTPYLFIALALTLLAAKAVVAGFSFAGLLSDNSHNVIEHGLDLLVVLLLFLAIIEARHPHLCPVGRWVGSK